MLLRSSALDHVDSDALVALEDELRALKERRAEADSNYRNDMSEVRLGGSRIISDMLYSTGL